MRLRLLMRALEAGAQQGCQPLHLLGVKIALEQLLDDRLGLARHLHDAVEQGAPVIGLQAGEALGVEHQRQHGVVADLAAHHQLAGLRDRDAVLITIAVGDADVGDIAAAADEPGDFLLQ